MSASEAAGGRDISDSNELLEAERSGAPFLVFRDREGRERVFCFWSESTSVAVGRLPSSDLVIDWDRQVSRRHARFERDADSWVLVDDGASSNGTFINEAQVTGRHRLKEGDVVRLGATTLLFRSPASAQSAPTASEETPNKIQLSSTQRRVLEALSRLEELAIASPGPAAEEQIAQQLVLSLAEVRGHLEVLCAKLGIEPLPLGDRYARLVERAYAQGLTSERSR
ncbi:MAG: FHA domain-containing protein [Solirubrobacterales bacterium]|nr:FHA domain-containing protein [Solirubrobacterales bacterium]